MVSRVLDHAEGRQEHRPAAPAVLEQVAGGEMFRDGVIDSEEVALGRAAGVDDGVCWLDSDQDCVRHRSRRIKIPTAAHVRDACHCHRLAERVPVGNASRSGRDFGDVVRMPRLERGAGAVRRVVMGAVNLVGSGDEVALDAEVALGTGASPTSP
jgi:hypothetical protein